MIIVAIRTGMRVSELVNMKIDWINYIAGEIHIKKTDKPVKFEPKYCSERPIPIDDDLLEDLKDFIGERRGGYIFRSRKKSNFYRYETKSIINKFNKLGMEVIGETIGTHIFRRTFCSRLLSQGTLITTISTLMGHKSLDTTWKYIRHIPNYAEYEKVKKSEFMKIKL